MVTKPRLIIVTGQTATGKTKLALEYARKYNGELVNCDSRQIYKYLDIITGKDKELVGAVWLYDIVDPKEYFSSFDYKIYAVPLIKDIWNRKKTPIIVGGTYLYIKHLLYEVATERIIPDWELRNKMADKSVSELQKILKDKNQKLFEKLNNSDRSNPQRLIRKIEIASSKKKLSKEKEGSLFDMSDVTFIGLRYENKDHLRNAIKQRVDNRLSQGAVDEVRGLLKKGYKSTDPGMKTIGYQQIIKYIAGQMTKEKATEDWISKEVQYAKRQYTFMKKDVNIKWNLI